MDARPPDMPIGREELLAVAVHDGILCFRVPEHIVGCHARELEDHLICLCLAVVSDCYDLMLPDSIPLKMANIITTAEAIAAIATVASNILPILVPKT